MLTQVSGEKKKSHHGDMKNNMKLEEKHHQHCDSLLSHESLILEVKIKSREQAHFLLALMYSEEFKDRDELPELISINWDSSVVSKNDADLLAQIKDN